MDPEDRNTVTRLDKLYVAVADRESFIAFLDELVAEQATQTLWVNKTLDQFLQAALAWTQVAAALTDEENEEFPAPLLPPQPSWQSFATILLAGRDFRASK